MPPASTPTTAIAIEALPRRADREGGRLIDAGSAMRGDARGDGATVDYAEFRELATSVRKWLALTSANEVSAERPGLRALRPAVPDGPWQDRAEDVVAERPALLIDAHHLTSERLPHLLETVSAAYGSPAICRAYADWTTPGLGSWFPHLRHYGVQPIHHFDTRAHSRSLVALALEALDLVERNGVTSLVLVGDLGAALPLVTRLKAAGVRVAVIGPDSNPDDVRRDAHEFMDIAALDGPAFTPARGRHRA